VWRHRGIIHEAFDGVKGVPHLRGWARGQPCPLPRRRVGDVVTVVRGLRAKQEAVAVVHDLREPRDEIEVAGDRGARRGAGEELRVIEHGVVHEDAAHGAREQVSAQQPARVDEVAPRPADAPGHGQAARREAAQDVRDEVVGQLPPDCHLLSSFLLSGEITKAAAAAAGIPGHGSRRSSAIRRLAAASAGRSLEQSDAIQEP